MPPPIILNFWIRHCTHLVNTLTFWSISNARVAKGLKIGKSLGLQKLEYLAYR